jgi:hypothetical protein
MFDAVSACFSISNLKDTINIIFWIIASIATIMSYFIAKKTLFNPVRSETVKYQFKLISAFFEKHASGSLTIDNAIDYSNILRMHYETDYILSILKDLDNKLPLDEEDQERQNFCNENLGGLFEIYQIKEKITLELVTGDFTTTRQYLNTEFIKKKEEEYDHLFAQRLYLTKTFHAFYTDLINLRFNPFIPVKIKNSIQNLIPKIYRNLMILTEILSTHIVNQTESKYQQIYSQFMENKLNHDADLESLKNEISNYFKVDM